MSLTGNEVKFLVSLGIDEKKSRAEIQSFINKTLKNESKLTFGVNKTQSNANINEFLAEKRKAVQQLIFGVNKGASLAKINSDLKSIKGTINPLDVTLTVDYSTSLAKINSFINTAKVKPKLIDLALNSGTLTGLNAQIDNTKLNKAKLSFKLTPESFVEVDLQLKNKVFTGAKLVAELDTAKTIAKITEQVSKMKLPNITLGGTPSSSSGRVTPSPTTSPSPSSDAISPFGTSSTKVYNESVKELEKLRAEYAQTGKEVVLFNNERNAGEKEFINNLKRTGRQVQVTTNEHTGEITKIVTTYKNSANEVKKEFFTPLKHQFTVLDSSTRDTKYEINGFVKAMSTLNNTETFNLQNGINKFRNELVLAKQSSTILLRDFERLMNATNNITSKNQLDLMNKELKEQQALLTRNIGLEEKQASLKLQYQQLITNLTRTEKMYLRTVNTEEAQLIRNRIAQISQLQALTNSGQNLYRLDDGAFRQAQNQIRSVRGEIRQLNADATEATKNSMGILDAMKVAFERFPIWMIASTAFYGTIRSVRELGTIIIDLDTKMTELKKVMADGTDFGAIFKSATADAETFGQTISSTLDAYAMFAKQGYSGNELSTLSQAALVGGNVGDIDTGRMAEYLTASLAQWNLESKDALGIVDTWNELSNDYATTVENLAQGLSKSGSTAKAMGLDFNQTSALVGTLTAKMKQSG